MKPINILLLFCLILSTISCTEEINSDYFSKDHIDKIIITGRITNEKGAHIIKVFHSQDFADTGVAKMETGASVSISDSSNHTILTEQATGEYATPSDFYAIEGHNYKLSVTLADGRTFEAQSTMTGPMTVDTVTAIKNDDSYAIFTSLTINKNKKQYRYYNETFLDNILLTTDLRDKQLYWIALINKEIASVLISNIKESGSIVEVRTYSVNDNESNYIEDVKYETIWSTELFRTLPANVRTNISNGGLGYFSTAYISRKQLLLKGTSSK